MFEWMNRHKKDIMKYTLWLVIPSFVLLYGYGQCAAPRQIRWVAKVNNEEISELVWNRQVENLQNELRQQSEQSGRDIDLPREELRKQALERSIVSTLFSNKAEKWGIATTNAEVISNIQDTSYFKDDSGNFDYNRYQLILMNNRITPAQYEASQRDSITRSKIQTVISETSFRAASEKERYQKRQNINAQIEFLAYEPSSYTEEVNPTEEGLKEFYEENKEDYKIPEQRRIAYARFYPDEHISDVTYVETQLERFFNENQQNYEISEKVVLEYLTYTASDFAKSATATEEEIRAYFEEHQEDFKYPERIRVRFISQPIAALAETQEVSQEEVKEYYTENEEQLKEKIKATASHILFRVTPEISAEEEEEVKNKLADVKKQIESGDLTFEEAARQFSQDGSARKGGALGTFGKGQMVQPFEEAVFSMPLNTVSDPVKTQFGYHLIKVTDRDKPIELAEEQLKKEKASLYFNRLVDSTQSLDALSDRYTIQTTDWFAKSDNVKGVPLRERPLFVNQTFSRVDYDGVYKVGNALTQNLYLVENLGHQDPRPMTLAEARDEIIEELQKSKGETIAQQTAAADVARIEDASLALDVVAQARGLTVEQTEPFGRDTQFIPGFGSRPVSVISTAFTMEEGDIEGPIRTNMGYHIIHLLSRLPSRLPELAEVRQRVENDFVEAQAARLARVSTNNFIDELFQSQQSIPSLAATQDVDWGSTEFFKQNVIIPGLGSKNNVNRVAFELENEMDISYRAVEERVAQRPQQQTEPPIEAYYAVQLLEIKEAYIPELEEVREEVEQDYRLKLAEPVAELNAKKTLAAIQSILASSGPMEATRALDLAQFQKGIVDSDDYDEVGEGGTFHGPLEINGMGNVRGIPGRAPKVVKTAFVLEPGQISKVVTVYQTETKEDGTRVKGRMLGAYIIQVLDKSTTEEDEDDPQSFSKQIEQFLNRQTQQLAFNAWIEEASARADIKYNDEIFNPQQEEEEGESEEETQDSSNLQGE